MPDAARARGVLFLPRCRRTISACRLREPPWSASCRSRCKTPFSSQSERHLIEKPVDPFHAVGREGDVLESAQQQQIEGAAGEPIHIAPVAQEGARSRAAHEPVEGIAVLIQDGARFEPHDPPLAGAFEQRRQFAQDQAALVLAQFDMAGPAVEREVEDRMTLELRPSPLSQPELRLRTGGDLPVQPGDRRVTRMRLSVLGLSPRYDAACSVFR